MRTLFILFFAINCICLSGQTNTIGFDLGFSSNKALLLNVSYYSGKNGFSIGMSREMVFPKGKYVDEQLSNYGRTIDSNGTYFYAFDFGYSRIIIKRLTLSGELSFGSKVFYTSYIDNRFNGGGYYLIDKKESLFGLGCLLGFNIVRGFDLISGYNTIRGFTFGCRFKIV